MTEIIQVDFSKWEFGELPQSRRACAIQGAKVMLEQVCNDIREKGNVFIDAHNDDASVSFFAGDDEIWHHISLTDLIAFEAEAEIKSRDEWNLLARSLRHLADKCEATAKAASCDGGSYDAVLTALDGIAARFESAEFIAGG